jgi:hypothetical protein
LGDALGDATGDALKAERFLIIRNYRA